MMQKSSKIAVAAAFAGMAAIGGAAFTGGGLTVDDSVDLDKFVGGSIEQVISGAEVTAINYTYADDDSTVVSSITVMLAGDDGIGQEVDGDLTGTGAPQHVEFEETTPGTYLITGLTYAGMTGLDVTVTEGPIVP